MLCSRDLQLIANILGPPVGSEMSVTINLCYIKSQNSKDLIPVSFAADAACQHVLPLCMSGVICNHMAGVKELYITSVGTKH